MEKEQLKNNLKSESQWLKGLFIVVFIVAYQVAELVTFVVVVFQFLFALFTGERNTNLTKFGLNLSKYMYQILQFVTYNTDTKPFPFLDWPNEEPKPLSGASFEQ